VALPELTRPVRALPSLVRRAEGATTPPSATPAEPTGEARNDVRMQRFVRYTAAAMLGYYVFLYVAAFVVLGRWHGSTEATVGYGAAVVVAAVLHVLVVRRDLRPAVRARSQPVLLACSVVVPVILAIGAPAEPEFDFFVLLPAASIALASRQWSRHAWKRAVLTAAAVAAIVVLRALVVQPGWGLAGLWAGVVSFVSVALLALLYVARDWVWTLLTELSEARDGIQEVAVARERKRFATDLHDIQGHHLQAIAVQGELAGKLIDRDPEQARSLVDAVQERARAALEETRAIVTDCREVSLLAELEDSCRVLAEAGGRCIVATAGEPDDDPPPLGGGEPGWSRGVVSFALDLDHRSSRLLGRVVREATTNLLRHSDNADLTVVLDRTGAWSTVVLRDAPGGSRRTRPTALSQPGRGLADLSEKADRVGGTLTRGPVPDGFQVRVSLPREQP
jgi:two-component system sensor histidine kinase DesK